MTKPVDIAKPALRGYCDHARMDARFPALVKSRLPLFSDNLAEAVLAA